MSKDAYIKYQSDVQMEIGRKVRHLVDKDTGESIDVQQVIKKVYNRRLCWKLTLSDFLGVLGIIESKQLEVVIHILENTKPSNNTYAGSRRAIAKRTGISLNTVGKIMKKLLDVGFLKLVQNGLYQISPEILMRGSETKRQILLSYYDESPTKVERHPIIKVRENEYISITLDK